MTLADFTVEILWEWFQSEGVDGCPCGCSWNGRLWQWRDSPDEMMYDHISMDVVDPQPCTRLENHWRHFCRWGHDGKNPYGGKAAALPTWIGRKEISFRFATLPRDGESGLCEHTPNLPGVLGSQDRAWKCPHGCPPYMVPPP